MQQWTGAEAKALRLAMRQTNRTFAAQLGVEPRTVAKWEQRGETITLLPDSQALLDTALQRASDEVQDRFAALVTSPQGENPPPTIGSDIQPIGTILVPMRIDGREVYVPVDRRTLLQAGIGTALAQLGLADATPRALSPSPSPVPAKLSTVHQVEDSLEHLRDQWHLLVKTDNLFGPRHAIRGVLDQLQIIADLLASVRGGARREVVKIGAQYAESASWLLEDGGDLGAAHYWNGRAMEWAHQADDRAMVSWSLYRRSQQAVIAGDAAEVIGLAQAAVGRERDELSAPMRAAITQQEAYGYALDGDEVRAQRKLDESHQWAATDTSGDARGGHGSFCTASYLELQRAACWLTLGRPGRAIQLYESTIPELPSVYRRDKGVAMGRLAQAYSAQGESEQAARTATDALVIARSAGSTRILDGVVAVSQELERHRSVPTVEQFLTELTAPQS